MRILKAFTFVAVAGALAAGAAQAQTGFGNALFTQAPHGVYSPYKMEFNNVVPVVGTGWVLPVSGYGAGVWGPEQDVFCVDDNHYVYYNNAYIGTYFTNLGQVASNNAYSNWIGTYTRSGHNLADYLAAAYLADAIRHGGDNVEYSNAIWNIMSGIAIDATAQGYKAAAIGAVAGGWGDIHGAEWVVVTDTIAAGRAGYHEETINGRQEFITHVTPEPATLLLLGTGLMGMLMAAGAFRRTAV